MVRIRPGADGRHGIRGRPLFGLNGLSWDYRDCLICGSEQTSRDKCGRQFVQAGNAVLQD